MNIALSFSKSQSLKVSYKKGELDLIQECLAGNPKAQFEIYSKYAKAMLNTCFRIVGKQDEAEDVLQEAFLAAFRQLDKFRGDATFGAWLKRIVINAALNHLKKKKLDFVSMDDKHLDADLDSIENDTQNELNFDDVQLAKVRSAIQDLPKGFQMILTLYLIEGYDHVEIAEILDISVSTSKSQYSRAKKKLRSIIVSC
jgi:RNA polymerase sigma-70 factor (ECF subfamily)